MIKLGMHENGREYIYVEGYNFDYFQYRLNDYFSHPRQLLRENLERDDIWVYYRPMGIFRAAPCSHPFMQALLYILHEMEHFKNLYEMEERDRDFEHWLDDYYVMNREELSDLFFTIPGTAIRSSVSSRVFTLNRKSLTPKERDILSMNEERDFHYVESRF